VILLADLDTPSSFRRFADGKAVFRKNRKTTYRAATAGVKAKSLVPPEDPYGRTTLVSGTNLSDFQYAGMYMHQPSGLYLTTGDGDGYAGRIYNPNTATWSSRDPEGEGTDATLYSYCANDPIDRLDPWGLDYTQTGSNLTVTTDTNTKTPTPGDPHHQNQLPPGSKGNTVPGVVAPPGHGLKVGDPATLHTNGTSVPCHVTDTTDNKHGHPPINHEHRPEVNPAAANAAGLTLVPGPQGPMPSNGQPGTPDIPATIDFPTGHP
jgi:RHS repeat-associated protein